MKNLILAATMLTLFMSCSSDNNDPIEEITPPETSENYLLKLDAGGYSPEWLYIIQNESQMRVVAGCGSISVKSGDTIEIIGELAATDDVPITLQIIKSATDRTEIVLKKSLQVKVGNYSFTPCYIQGTGTGYSNGGKIWKSEAGVGKFTIE